MSGARIFVGAVFLLLGLSFIIPSAVLMHEYGWTFGYAISALYSHTFLYYSTIGLVALAAFFSPAVIFVDFYWNIVVPAGRLRFIVGSVVVVLASIYLSNLLFGVGFVPKALLPAATIESSEHRVPAIFELSPETLTAAAVDSSGCAAVAKQGAGNPGISPVAAAVCRLQQVSQHTASVSSLARRCPQKELIDLIGPQTEDGEKRFCFATPERVTAAECCEAQGSFRSQLAALYAGEPRHSATLTAHLYTLPFKVFFMLVVLIIGLMLTFWRTQVVDTYSFCLGRLENGVLIGATTMLFWPIANQAFLQSASVLFGSDSSSAYQTLLGPAFSIAFGLWALLIMFFFFFHMQRDVTLLVRVLGALASVLAVMKYDLIADQAVRWMGSGASWWVYPLLTLVGLALLVWSLTWSDRISPSVIMQQVSAFASRVDAGGPTTGSDTDTN
jgi:hypothetical protein